jgi:hypothetical protein
MSGLSSLSSSVMSTSSIVYVSLFSIDDIIIFQLLLIVKNHWYF